MQLQDKRSFQYEENQLVEVICQLRFPTILSIDAKAPADFQDLVREAFPRYMLQPQTVVQSNGEKQSVKNHCFISTDGFYKLSLTKDFIALSTVRYSNWQEFANWLDEPLGHFISVYKPAFFERVGLRYVNAISREKLELQGCPWRELIAGEYLSVLVNEDIDEGSVNKCSVDIERKLDEKCRLRLHSGPGYIKRNVRTGNTIRAVQENEARFIFDQDIYSTGNIDICAAAAALDIIHDHADELFYLAITDKLHQAMKPVLL